MCDAFPNKSQSFAGFGCITANRNGWFQIDDSWYITLGPSKSQLGSRNNRFSSCLSYSKSWRCRYKWQLASLPGRCHQFRLCPMMHILTPELCLPECGVTILLKNYLYYIMYIYIYIYIYIYVQIQSRPRLIHLNYMYGTGWSMDLPCWKNSADTLQDEAKIPREILKANAPWEIITFLQEYHMKITYNRAAANTSNTRG